MIHTLLVWLLAAGFLGAGLFNVAGTRATRDEFVAWGYPAWWCWVTGGLEILTAALIAVPLVRGAGIVLGALIILDPLSRRCCAIGPILNFRRLSRSWW